MAPAVLIAVPLLFALAALCGGCRLWVLRCRVRRAWTEIEAQLQSRGELVERLLERAGCSTARGSESLAAVEEARRQAVAARGLSARAQAENQLSDTLHGLFAAAAAGPEPEVDASLRSFKEDVTGAEERIAAARRSYNHRVMAWNVRIARFPWSLISRPAGLRPVEYFVLDEPATLRRERC